MTKPDFQNFDFKGGSPYGPVLKIDHFRFSILIFAIWGPRYMKFWLWAYFLVLSSTQKTAFQNFDFQGRSPYGPVLNIRWISDKIFQSHQKSQGHDILALGLIWANLDHYETRFSKFLFLRGSPYGPVVKIRWISDKTLSAFSKAKKSPRFMKFWL